VRIGVPKETKEDEHRVAMTPAAADELTRRHHEVVIETGAGAGAGFVDADFEDVGATIDDRDAAWGCELVVKVKEPQPNEFAYLRDDQVLFAYLHLAAEPGVAEALRRAGTTAVAYETVQDEDGGLPLLAPMSEVAGRMAVQAGARHLEAPAGGRGVLLPGVPGVEPASVVVLGGGTVGMNAALIALGMRAHVAIIDIDLARLRELEVILPGRVTLVHSTRLAIRDLLTRADLVIGAVLLPGDLAPTLVTRGDLPRMRKGSVIVDVSVDQGGCIETSRPTTHSQPTFTVEGIVHYAVANMPGAVPVTATRALVSATLPYVTAIADLGIDEALDVLPALEPGVNVRAGRVVNPTVALALAAPAG
jgi:alanine dehydrogenase